MRELPYTVENDSHLGLNRRQIEPGQPLLDEGPSPDLRVVALGGGTGLPILLQGLKTAFFPPGRNGASPWDRGDRDRLAAVVTVADDGGSSGRLRQAYRVLPPGDIRNCLLALSDGEPKMADIFKFRFNGGGDLSGHSLGNLILTALSEVEGDFSKAIERMSEILKIRGRVFPATADEVSLLAEFTDGSCIRGESRIASVRRPIRRVRLQPEETRVLPQVREVLTAAHLILIGPGSLYTSLIPTLLVKGLADAIADSKARIALVMNLMTEPGETDGYTAADHLLALRRHAPQVVIHDVLLNSVPIPRELVDRYAGDGAAPIPAETEPLRALGCRPLERDLLGGGTKVRHEPHKLAQAVLDLATEVRP